jgi:hypothetical protein
MTSMQRKGYSIVRLVVAIQVGQIDFGRCYDVDLPLSFKQFTDFTFKWYLGALKVDCKNL